MDEVQLAIRIRETFEESHSFCSLDYISSRIGVDSVDVERVLRNMEREGWVRYDAASEIWRLLK
ncbi:MAG: hypothetical protein ABSA11_17150 [Candidatus Bathyarchaeia archaeon]|jgi:DNA-binding IclR family transcriptional regulator